MTILSERELEWDQMIKGSSGLSKSEQIDRLLKEQVWIERRRQRCQDEDNDHPIALFSRQKNQSMTIILLALFILSAVHGIQLVALWNVNSLAGFIDADEVEHYVSEGKWISNNEEINSGSIGNRTLLVHKLISGSESPVLGFQYKYGFCLTPTGYLETIFNVTCGLFLIYVFIFRDVWKVIFDTVITRSIPGDKYYYLMLFGTFWLVCMNCAVLVWAAIESGLNVVATSGDFFSVLFNSLTIFIILSIDETVLPLVRFMVEDAGRLKDNGDLEDEQLILLTHGLEYYKPGYGHHMFKILFGPAEAIRKVLAFINLLLMASVYCVPLGISIYYAVIAFKPC